MATPRQETSCPAGYQYWTCTFNGHNYAGCCGVDACKQNPVGCPIEAQPETEATATSTASSRTSSSVSSLTSTTLESSALATSASATSASVTSTAATSAPSSSGNDNHGILIPVGGLVALVVISVVVAVAGAILAWQRYCKRRDNSKDAPAPDLPGMYQVQDPMLGFTPGHQDVVSYPTREPSWAPGLAHEPNRQQSVTEYRGVSMSGALSYRDSTHAPVSPSTGSISPALHAASPPPPSLSPASPTPFMSPALSELDSNPVQREMEPIAPDRARAMELERMAASNTERYAELGKREDQDPEAIGGSPREQKDPDVYPNRWPKYGGSPAKTGM